MSSLASRVSAISVLLLILSACGGGGGGGSGLVSTPTPTPAPPPIPAPVPSGTLLGAVQTASPASPEATGLTPNFAALGQVTAFPLLMTAIDFSFGGDVATTDAGAVLSANPDGTYKLTLNNATLGVNAVAATPFPGTSVGTYLIATSVQSSNLDYTRFGYWLRFQSTEGLSNAGAWAGGYLTPINQIPTQGSASYAGSATGIYNDNIICDCAAFVSDFTGLVNLTADFAALSLTGGITNITLSSRSGFTPGAMNDIGFSATIDRQNNFFNGTTFVTSQPGGSWAFSQSAAGNVKGRFYGPNAREVGAVFGLSDGSRRLIGSFGARN